MGHDFWRLSADERDAAYEEACNHYGVESFFDLDPEQRAEVMDRAVAAAFAPAARRPA